jgi:Flp pilus assembly protein TadD
MEGITALRRALELNPTSAKYRMALVSTEIAELDLVRAENDLTPYLNAHPDDWQVNYYMAVILNQKPRTADNLRLGIAHAEKALPGMMHDPHIYNLLGLLFLASGRTQAAYRAFLEGYKISPHSKEMLHGLLDCDNRQGDTREAALVASYLDKEAANENQIDQLKHTLGYNHKDTGAALELAHLYEVTGKQQQAFGLFVQALHEAPDDPRIRPAFSALLQRTGQSAMAKQILKPDFTP